MIRITTQTAARSAVPLTLGLAALFVLGGCGGSDPPDSPPEATELVDDRPDVPEATVTPRPRMLEVEPVRIWYEYGTRNEHTMLVTFASQGPPCEVLDRVEVDESDTQAIITLYQGRDPDADPNDPCDGPTQVAGVDVPLTRDYGPAGVSPYIRAGIIAETGEGPIVNGGSLRDSQ